MNKKINFNRKIFKSIYLNAINDILKWWTPEMQDEFAGHCINWSKGRFDFASYLRYSELRCWIAYEKVSRHGVINSWCDIGGFFGAFPLALHRMGVNVTMTESLKYYSNSFNPLFNYLMEEGVKIVDCDPFSVDSINLIEGSEFDVVSAMAVLEHYPHSVKVFVDFMRSVLSPDGRIYIEVPNIAYWPRRWGLMNGRSPLSSFEDIYKSQVPYIGHHHEYTMDELHRLSVLAKLKVMDQVQFNYSFVGPFMKRLVSDPIMTFMSFVPSMRESLAVVLAPSAEI